MNTDKSRVSTKCKMRFGQFALSDLRLRATPSAVTCRERRPARMIRQGISEMMPGWERWFSDLSLFALTAASAHLVMSFGQTLMHCWLGYARGHLVSAVYRGTDGNNTPFFLIPTILVGGGLLFILPFNLFVAMVFASAASFYAHVYIDKEYHVEGSSSGTLRVVQAQAAASLRPPSACEQQFRRDRLLLGQDARDLPQARPRYSLKCGLHFAAARLVAGISVP